MVASREGQIKHKISQEHLVKLESRKKKSSKKKKEYKIKKNGEKLKGHRSHSEEAATEQVWNNLSIDMNYSIYKSCIYSLYTTYTNKPYL